MQLILILLLLFTIENKALAYNSMLEFEAHSAGDEDTLVDSFGYLGDLKTCFEDYQHLMYLNEIGDMNNVYIPPVLGRDTRGEPPNSSMGTWSGISSVGRGAVYLAMLSSYPFGTLLALLAVGIEFVIMISVCTNAYVVQPHEYVNRELGLMKCEKIEDGTFVNAYEPPDPSMEPATAADIPFYYSCDPTWDPVTQTNIDPTGIDADLVGRVWGYMGAASPYCIGRGKEYFGWAEMKQHVGEIRLEFLNGLERFFAPITGYEAHRCSKSDRAGEFLRAGEADKYMNGVHFHAYYRFDQKTSKVQICVAAPFTLIPVRVGCSQIAPPSEEYSIDPFLELYTAGTRCYYFLVGRKDLWSVGQSIPAMDQVGHNGTPVKKFLMSDLHVTSTVVGCIKDLLIKVFLSPTQNPGYVNQGFFIVVTERLRQIVLSVLVLYVALIGIKIMSSPQVPSRGEFTMYLLKFALVLYFSTAGAWYYVQEDEAYGLFPTLIWGADEIADLFLGAQNDNDPRGLCRYKILGDQLLAQRNIDPGSIGSGVVATVGSTKLKMTVWDLVDCKVVNYINLGSCHYTLGGLIGAWFVGAAFFVGGNGILLAIVSFLYCFMLLLVIFRFTHIFVLSAFMIAILVLVCPIFLCFALFEATKSIFDSWMKMLLGYILYPALLFAFVALMLMTFDSVFYGDLNVDFDPNVPITEACEGIHSAYCITVKAIEKDPCLVNGGYFGEAMTDQIDLGLLGSYTVLKGSVVNDYLGVVVRLMLFALLYYLFVGAVTNFLAVLTQVQDLNSMAKGDINLTAPIKKLASMAGGLASAGISKAVGSAAGVVDKISSKT